MNPDKLFDYLDGRLSEAERAAVEDQLLSDQRLQRELAIARGIHAGMHGDVREVLLPPEVTGTERSRKMTLRVGVAFIILMAVNVGAGLWIIARHETRNPNRALLEAQMRQQITKSLEHAAQNLTPPPLGINEITIETAPGRLDAVANEIVTIAGQLGGSATKGLPDHQRLSVLVDLPSNHESKFRDAIASITERGAGSSAFANQPSRKATAGQEATADKTTPATAEKKSFVVQIVESPAEQH